MIRLTGIVLTAVLTGCTPARPQAQSGEAVYAQTCATCHGPDGLGVNDAFPPLAGGAYVNMPDSLLVRLALRGMRGPIKVNGKQYNNVMPPHSFLTDVQLAAVLSFVREEFGTPAAISPEQVASERPEYGAGPMLTIEQLTGTER